MQYSRAVSQLFQRERPIFLLYLTFPTAQLIHPHMTFNIHSRQPHLMAHGSSRPGYFEAHLPKCESDVCTTLAARAMSHFHSLNNNPTFYPTTIQ